jgi:hypothetical protein
MGAGGDACFISAIRTTLTAGEKAMNRAIRFLPVAILALLLISATVATATTVQKFTLRDLALKSSTIVRATVDDATSSWDQSHKEIYTFYTLRILDHVKGMKGETTITLRQLGGVVDNIESIVPGMPSFRKGEEVVVFLTQKDAAGYPWVMGLQQGKYTVATDANGKKSVRNELSNGVTRVGVGGAEKGPSVSGGLPLDAFLAGIKTDLNEAGKIRVDPTTHE